MIWSFYDPATGIFTDRFFVGSEALLEVNTPVGTKAAAGHFSRDNQRVNIGTGLVEEWQSPSPPADSMTDWKWLAASRRWVPKKTAAALAVDARAARDARLAASDWVVLRALEAGTPVPAPWRAYRQALRDVTASPDFPTRVDWPTPPPAGPG